MTMHDLIREMGRNVVREESDDPGKRSSLWDPIDIYEVLKYKSVSVLLHRLSFIKYFDSN